MDRVKNALLITLISVFITGCSDNPNLNSTIKKGNPNEKPKCGEALDCAPQPWVEMFAATRSKSLTPESVYGLWNGGSYNAPTGKVSVRYRIIDMGKYGTLEIAQKCESNGEESFGYGFGKLEMGELGQVTYMRTLSEVKNILSDSGCDFYLAEDLMYNYKLFPDSELLQIWLKGEVPQSFKKLTD